MSQTKTYLISQQEMEEEFFHTKGKILSYVPSLFTRDMFFSFLSFLHKWQHYSIYNIILIHMQYRDATYLAGFHRWEELSLLCGNKPNHTIIKPAFRKRGITLLMPFSSNRIEKRPSERFLGYKHIFVFDVSQTNDIPIPKVFSPYVPIKDMDFSLFLKILRAGNERFVRFLPYHTKEERDFFKGSQLVQNTILFDAHSEKRMEAVFSSYIRYVTQMECKKYSFPPAIEGFISQAAKISLYSFYEIKENDTYGRLQMEALLEELSDKSKEELFIILHVILQITKACIFRIKSGFKVQLATQNDMMIDKDLLSLEEKIRKDLAP